MDNYAFGLKDANVKILNKTTDNVTKSNNCNQCNFASSRSGNLRRHLKTHSGEKLNKCNQCDFASSLAGTLRQHFKTHSGEKSNHATKRLCIISSRQFEGTLENKQCRKAQQMQPMRLCLFSGRENDNTFENTLWKKVKQM